MCKGHVAIAGALAAALCVIAGQVLADGGAQTVGRQGVVSGYQSDSFELYRSTLDGGDVADITSTDNVALDKIYCGGFQSVTVSGRFSVSGATSVIRFVRYNSDETEGDVSEATLTAKTATDGTLYFSNPIPFDTEGAAYTRVLHADPSSGTVTLWSKVH